MGAGRDNSGAVGLPVEALAPQAGGSGGCYQAVPVCRRCVLGGAGRGEGG